MKVKVTIIEDCAVNGEHLPAGSTPEFDQAIAGNLITSGRAIPFAEAAPEKKEEPPKAEATPEKKAK